MNRTENHFSESEETTFFNSLLLIYFRESLFKIKIRREHSSYSTTRNLSCLKFSKCHALSTDPEPRVDLLFLLTERGFFGLMLVLGFQTCPPIIIAHTHVLSCRNEIGCHLVATAPDHFPRIICCMHILRSGLWRSMDRQVMRVKISSMNGTKVIWPSHRPHRVPIMCPACRK
jgi:hypothetical protein